MRIAIAGASGTGKTTIALAIAHRYQIPLNPVGARSVAKAMGLDSPYNVDQLGLRAKFQRELFEQKSAWEAEHESFVTDRTYFDNLGYCMLHMGADLPAGILEEYHQSMKRYDLVFQLRAQDHQDLSDGIRVVSPAYHWAYEALLQGLYNYFGYEVIRLSGDMHERVRDAFDVIARQFRPTDPATVMTQSALLIAREALHLLASRLSAASYPSETYSRNDALALSVATCSFGKMFGWPTRRSGAGRAYQDHHKDALSNLEFTAYASSSTGLLPGKDPLEALLLVSEIHRTVRRWFFPEDDQFIIKEPLIHDL